MAQVLKASAASTSSSSVLDAHDATTLTTFNPFSDEDEREHSSYALMTSLLSKVKHSLTAPLSSTPPPPQPSPFPAALNSNASTSTVRTTASAGSASGESIVAPRPRRATRDKLHPMLQAAALKPSGVAPPLVSRTPALSEPAMNFQDSESVTLRSVAFFGDQDMYGSVGTSIPGFPNIQDDAKSVHTIASLSALNIGNKGPSVSKIIRRIRGEGACCADVPSALLNQYRSVARLLDGRRERQGVL